MRRENRKQNRKKSNDKAITYGMLGASILVIAIISIMTYSNMHKEDDKYANLENNRINNISNSTNDTRSASTQMGKTVNEVATNNTVKSTNTVNTNEITNTISTLQDKITQNATQNTTVKTNTPAKSTTKENANVEKNKISFTKPVQGDISKEFAKDQLIYSNTLEEWTTHLGIDIKAEEGTEVVASEEGTVKSIKNDPRYGYIITIEHKDGYQSIYSNLQSTEDIVAGEKVEKGQAIATVGNTAAFEAKDGSHLHFEILKNYSQVNPMEYIK